MSKKVSSEMKEFYKYEEEIRNRMIDILERKKIAKDEIAELWDVNIKNVYAVWNGKTRLSLDKIYLVCKKYNISFEYLFGYKEKEQKLKIDETSLIDLDVLDMYPGFIYDPDEEDYAKKFIADTDDKAYYFYTKPTNTSTESKYLKGRLYICSDRDKKNRPYLKAILKLEHDEEKWAKEYVGNLILLSSAKVGLIILAMGGGGIVDEISTISFNYDAINSTRFKNAIALCSTISSTVHKRRATAEKAIISSVEINDEDLEVLDIYLACNTKELYISSSDVAAMSDEQKKYIDTNQTYYKTNLNLNEYKKIQETLRSDDWNVVQKSLRKLPFVRISTDYDIGVDSYINN